MKKTGLLILLCVLFQTGRSAVFAQHKLEMPPKAAFDTALMMLQEFVVKGGDTKLGFTPENVMQAQIEKDSGFTFYMVNEDSALQSQNMENVLIHMNKIVFPIKVGTTICGSVTMIRFGKHWAIREFQDAGEIKTYMETMGHYTHVKEGNKDLLAVYLPSTGQTVILDGDVLTGNISSTNLIDTLGAKKFYKPTLNFMNTPQIPVRDFIAKYRDHLLAEASKKKKPK